MGVITSLKSIQKLSQQQLELEKSIFRIQKAKIGLGPGKISPSPLKTVAEMADKFTPSVKEDAVKEFAKKASKGLRGKMGKWLEQFVETIKAMKGFK